MALDKQQLPIAINQGLDTKSDPKQISPGKFLTIENGVFLKNGEIQKCNGYAKSSQTFPFPFPKAVGCGTLKNAMFILTENGAYSYAQSRDFAESINSQAFTKVGNYSPLSVRKTNAINQDTFSPSCAFDSTLKTLVKVWSESETTVLGTAPAIKYSATDTTDNSLCLFETKIDGGSGPQIVTNPNIDYYLVIYEDNTPITPKLKAAAINKTYLNQVKTITLDVSPTYTGVQAFTVYMHPTAGDKAYVTWASGAGQVNTRIAYFSGTYDTFAAPTPVTLVGTVSNKGAAIITYQPPVTNQVFFAFVSSTVIKGILYNSTLSSVINPLLTLMTTAGPAYFQGAVLDYYDEYFSGFKLYLFATRYNGVPADKLPQILYTITDTAIAVPSQTFVNGCAIMGNGVVDRTYEGTATLPKRYLPVTCVQSYGSSLYSLSVNTLYTNFLVRFGPENETFGYVAAKFYDLNAYGIDSVGDHPRMISFVNDAANNRWFGIVKETAGNASLCTVSFDHKPVFAEMANNLHTTGGYLGMYDGAEFAEHGFFQQPVEPVVTRTGAGSVAAGTYYYSVTYQWQDAFGQIYESAPSAPVSFTVTGGMGASALQIAVPNVKLTNKASQIYITVYRSTDGFTFYQLPSTGLGGSYASNKEVWSSNVADNNTTASLLSQPILYTSGGELSNAQAPACSHVATYKRRLIVSPSEDSNSIWYSKEIIPATSGAIGTPVNWAFEFVLSVDEKGGPIVGTIQLDDKLIIGKASTLSVLTGDGPANNGAQNDFSTPQIIATDTGFESGRSLVLMPLGILFKSPKGYYLLDRSLSVSYIGAPVENFNSYACTSAVLLYDRNEVWFGTTTNQIIYNYYFNLWSTATFSWTHAVSYQSKYTGVLNVNLIQETPGIYTRNGSGYALKVTTGWMSFANVQGYQRVYKMLLLGTYKSAHKLQVDFAYDFVDSSAQTTVFELSQTADSPLQNRIFLSRQKCESVKMTLTDLAPTSGSWAQGYSLSNMAFELGVKKGLNKLPASKSVG